MNTLQHAFLSGYESALEKVGFHDAEILSLLKIAAPFKGPQKPGGAQVPGMEYTPEEWQNMFEASQAKSQAMESEARAARAAAEARAAGIPGNAIAPAAAAGGLSRPAHWFSKQPMWAKGLMGGAAGLGTLGLGMGLGHALSD